MNKGNLNGPWEYFYEIKQYLNLRIYYDFTFLFFLYMRVKLNRFGRVNQKQTKNLTRQIFKFAVPTKDYYLRLTYSNVCEKVCR